MNGSTIALLALLVSTSFISGCVSHYQFPKGAEFSLSELSTKKGESKIVIYREKAVSMSAFSWVVSHDEVDLAEISAGTYLVLSVPPSEVVLKADLKRNTFYALPVDVTDVVFDTIQYKKVTEENASVNKQLLAELRANDGDILYYKWHIENGEFGAETPIPSLVRVDESVAKKELIKTKMAML